MIPCTVISTRCCRLPDNKIHIGLSPISLPPQAVPCSMFANNILVTLSSQQVSKPQLLFMLPVCSVITILHVYMSDKNRLLFIHYCFCAGTLILKIPWKNLYKEPLEVVIEDLFAIAGPNAGM